MANICNNCNCTTNLFFCPSCSKIFSYPNFIKGDSNLEQKLSSYTKQLVQKAKKVKNDTLGKASISNIANETVNNYFQCISYLRDLCANSSLNAYLRADGDTLYPAMIKFGNDCLKNECQIAIVGTIKAGKSCLINAILDKELASVNEVPETASLTKFRYSPENYVKVKFYNSEKWSQLWKSIEDANKKGLLNDENNFLEVYKKLSADELEPQFVNHSDIVIKPKTFEELKNEIAKYSSAKEREHFFVEELEVGIKDFDVPKNIVFVDTPGLNDVITYRSDITKKYLASANVVLLASKAVSAELNATELYIIGESFTPMKDKKERVYIIGTQFDMQPSPYSYWENKTKPEWLKFLSGKNCFASMELAEKHLLPGSPYIYSLVQRYKVNPSACSEEMGLLEDIVNRFLGRIDQRALIKEHGEEKAREIYFNLTTEIRLNNYSNDLLEKTNIPFFKNMIFKGPVQDAEKIILQDLSEKYMDIKNKIKEIKDSIFNTNLKTIEKSNTSDIKEQINELEKRITKMRSVYNRNKEALDELLNDLKTDSQKRIKDIKLTVKL